MRIDNSKEKETKDSTIKLPLDNVKVHKEVEVKEEVPPTNHPVEKEEEVVVPPVEQKPIEKKEEIEQLEIDGVVYSLDKDGNALNDKNEIVHTKEAIAKFEESLEQEDVDNQITAISKVSGISILDDTGVPIVFENTVDGFAKRELAIKQLGEQEGYNKGFENFLKSNPDLAEIIEYKKRFGTIEGFSNNVDYSKINLKDDDEQQWYDIVYKAEIQKGTSPERAKRLAEFEKTNNTLKDAATESLNYLAASQQNEINSRIAVEQKAYNESLQEEINFYGVSYDNSGIKIHNVENSLYDSVVSKGSIAGYTIPKDGIKIKGASGKLVHMSRQDLFDYLAKPVTEIDGVIYSAAQLDELRRMSNPQEFALRAIQNLNGGMEQLVESEIASRTVKQIRKLSTTNKSKSSSNYKGDDKGGSKKIILPV